MGAGHQGNPQLDDDDPLVDRYLLQFFPAGPAPDQVVKQTSARAAYWHDYARRQPPPPTPEERAEAKRQAASGTGEGATRRRLAEETRNWGGTLPSERLRNCRGQRSRSRSWTAHWSTPAIEWMPTPRGRSRAGRPGAPTSRRSGPQVDWIAPALEAMARGEELPEMFQEPGRAFDRAWNDDQVVHTAVTPLDGRIDNFSQQSMAFLAIIATYNQDPLEAAIDAVRIAASTFGYGRTQEFFAELRQAFRSLNE
jgi:hypothetical protein